MKDIWTHVNDELPPENEILIGISKQKWVCIGKIDEKLKHLSQSLYRTNFITTVGWDVHSIEWWHPIPELPWKEKDEWFNQDDWIACDEFPPPSYRNDSIEFILFDEEIGIAEAEYWGGYQSDTVSCKFHFKKPLFWRPFPRLPISIYNVLQI